MTDGPAFIYPFEISFDKQLKMNLLKIYFFKIHLNCLLTRSMRKSTWQLKKNIIFALTRILSEDIIFACQRQRLQWTSIYVFFVTTEVQTATRDLLTELY